MTSRRDLLPAALGLSAFHKLYAQSAPHAALFDFDFEAQNHISHGA
jgi:hypothetical protein